MSITISSPTPNSSVGWAFLAQGDYNLALKALSGTDLGTIVVTVYESDGTTPLPNTTVIPSSIPIPSDAPSGGWKVRITHDGNYNGAVIRATLTPTGGSPETATVSGIDITS